MYSCSSYDTLAGVRRCSAGIAAGAVAGVARGGGTGAGTDVRMGGIAGMGST